MGTKHDVLTEEELASYRLNRKVILGLEDFLSSHPDKKPGEINILDWGCGRGRSVLKLREQGFNAFGVDIDLKTVSNGFALIKQRGFSPTELLKPVSDVGSFEDGFFHFVFSEQVLEHVADLTGVVKELARLTAPGGIGVHSLPGAKKIWESHLYMPFVHWLPKTFIRKYWIAMMLLLSAGPKKNSWPETKGKSLWGQAEVYFNYMNNRTYYRDNNQIRAEFEKFQFDATYEVDSGKWQFLRFLPSSLRRNGFPRGSVAFFVLRRNIEHDRTIGCT